MEIEIVVSGSFHKHWRGLKKCIGEFESIGVRVLSPKPSEIINPEEEFPLPKSDDTSDPKTLEQRHLDAIESADALYLYNPRGYVGLSVAMEIGYANAISRFIFAKCLPQDATLRHFVDAVLTPKRVKRIFTT